MKRFRVLSDLHIDVNSAETLKLNDKSIFTVICGDTSGYPELTIKWIKENCPYGVGVSGNHLPYNSSNLTILQLREQLATEFTSTTDFSYLDCETQTFFKVIDGILFIGSCMYTDMSIKHETWNPVGDMSLNMKCSEWNMNDYRWGIKEIKNGRVLHITAKDYYNWFKIAYSKIDAKLNENEASDNPLPVVLITHHSLITDFVDHNGYMEPTVHMYSQREFNLASYLSDMKMWLIRHPSIQCYCCGHIHDVDKNYRHFHISRDDGSKILVVNNARGYISRMHDRFFNKNLFVNTETWKVEETPLSAKDHRLMETRRKKMISNLAWFI